MKFVDKIYNFLLRKKEKASKKFRIQMSWEEFFLYMAEKE